MNTTTAERHDVIEADRVEGTSVYGSDGDKMGSVKSVVIGKRDGKVRHAVLSIGGFLGIGDELHSIPWSKLDYDEKLDGYKLTVTKDQLKKAPTFKAGANSAYDRDFQAKNYEYYGERIAW